MKLPAVWRDALGDARSVVLSRGFNRPTNLDEPGVSVLLRFESPQTVESVRLNGHELVDGSDLIGLMAPANRLTVRLARRDATATVLDARLEIIVL